MAPAKTISLPPLAPFPEVSWLTDVDGEALVGAWRLLVGAYLSLSDEEFVATASDEDSVAVFVSSFVRGAALAPPLASPLLKSVFQLTSRLLALSPPALLLDCFFLSHLARLYPKKDVKPVVGQLFDSRSSVLESSLASLKKLLLPHLTAGIRGDLKLVQSRLVDINPLLHASSHASAFLLAGSDFFDGLVSCFRVMNPPLRKVIVTTTYLCLVGVSEAQPPKWAMLGDQLFALKTAADAHKQGPLNVNDSLVAELVTATPLLRTLLRAVASSGASQQLLAKRITDLEPFRKGPMARPKRRVKARPDKGKGRATRQDEEAESLLDQMSKITQIQDLFPELGAGFLTRCLDEYDQDTEQVVASLLSESLPAHLASANRSESLRPHEQNSFSHQARPVVSPRLPTRRNVFDGDELDRLATDTSKISFGKRLDRTADDVLRDKSTAPSKAAILSALAAFDSDDDERDDTYDAVDVGGTVDSTNQEADGVNDSNEELLFRAYTMDDKTFSKDAATRRAPTRSKLREETGMTDEAIEGWATMLTRNPQQMKRLQSKYAFAGQQQQLERTAWRAGSGTEDSDVDANRAGRGGRASRGRGRGRGRGRVGHTEERDTEAARRKKEANKASRANHNRRDGRARKMARGGMAG
ncbi:hypothetical protein L249_0044 [Ophiocordyceps polyrhachis-furcata BCC 54312]|uniref:CUE domain-containing protein n=1 Tax=Ophiocordyceps polyrhachis-furcata BCC 54312 TaxID=1330021 RepID=A0A367LD96_9HYPO|nr:hypothetical protein L249_0044 [Ophiocordyceps polyrhachis-furcata BCC 54312]